MFQTLGQYSVRFGARESDEDGMKSYFVRKLTHDERAVRRSLCIKKDANYLFLLAYACFSWYVFSTCLLRYVMMDS